MAKQEVHFENLWPTMVRRGIKSLIPSPILEARHAYQTRKADSLGYPFNLDTTLNPKMSFRMHITNPKEYLRAVNLVGERAYINRMGAVVKDHVVWDIGASQGTHSIAAALFGASDVYAFEPEPDINTGLSRNVQMNSLEHKIYLLPFAISNQDGNMCLFTSGPSGDAPSIYKTGRQFDRSIVVPSYTVQTLVTELSVPQVMKIDVEGGLVSVLEGFGVVRPQHLFIEIHPFYGEDPNTVGTMLGQMDYEFVWGQARGSELLVQMVHKNT